jgi:hypothetical protein
VSSGTGVRADCVMSCPATKRAAVLLIETDFIPMIGPTRLLGRKSLQLHRLLPRFHLANEENDETRKALGGSRPDKWSNYAEVIDHIRDSAIE